MKTPVYKRVFQDLSFAKEFWDLCKDKEKLCLAYHPDLECNYIIDNINLMLDLVSTNSRAYVLEFGPGIKRIDIDKYYEIKRGDSNILWFP